MAKKKLDKSTLDQLEDWYGNNAAVCCPTCFKVFIVSGFINKGLRQCPKCGQSEARITNEEVTIEWSHTEETSVLTRAELDATKRLDEFVKLVEEGGAVDSRSVKNKLPKAEKVAFMERGEKMIAVAAKKTAIPLYAKEISDRSGHHLEGNIPELGYVAVSRDCRGQHLAGKVVGRILMEFGSSVVFATTTDGKMRCLLANSGFRWVGHEWNSKRANEKLSLWIRDGG